MPSFGTIACYLCIRNKKTRDMKNTDNTLSILGNVLSSEACFDALREMIDDLGLELEDIKSL